MIRSPLYRDQSTGLVQEISKQDHLLVSYPEKNPAGFLSLLDNAISFNQTTRTFTISPTNGSFTVYFSSLPHTFNSSQNITISDVTGLHYIYFDNSTKLLAETTQYADSLLSEHILISAIYWREDLQKQIYFGDERHSIVMSNATRLHLRATIGAQYNSGLDLITNSNYVGDNDEDAEVIILAGSFRNEDKLINTPQVSNIPVLYRTGNNLWNKTTADQFPLVLSGDNNYNGLLPAANSFFTEWSLSEAQNNNIILIHILACNDVNTPIVAILGGVYKSVDRSYDYSVEEFSKFDGLSFSEFVPLYTLQYKVNSTFANTPKATIVKTVDGKKFIDWRKPKFFGINNRPSATISTFTKQLSGKSVIVSQIEHNLSDILSYKVINNLGNEVSVVLDTIGSDIVIKSNIELLNHELIVKGI